MNNPKKTFVILAPKYNHNSAGIVVLHELCDAIISCGYSAHIVLFDTSEPGWKYFLSNEEAYFNNQLKRTPIPNEFGLEWVQQVLNFGITIYPEIINGNPLNAKNIVRYFLNGDGVITGQKSEYTSNDFCLAFSNHYFDNPHAYLIKLITTDEFNDHDAIPFEKRTLDLTYFGKGPRYTNCFRIKNSVVLGSDWPKTKPELAVLLKNTRYLFCWDSQSGISTDAIICGAKVVFLQFEQVTESIINQHEWAPIPYLKGEISINEVSICENPNYNQFRKAFIDKIKASQNQWLANVSNVITKVFSHFSV